MFVGQDTEPFCIHQDLLTSSSRFFRNGCDGPWKEGEEGVFRLPDQQSELFEIYQQWLYTGAIFCAKDGDDNKGADGKMSSKETVRLRHLCIMGDYLQDHNLKNAVVDAMFDRTIEMKTFPTGGAKDVYAELPTDCGFRRLLVDFWAYSHEESSMEYEAGDVVDAPTAFWKDILTVMFKAGAKIYASGPKPWEKDRCQYHEHPDGEARCSA